LGIEEISSSHPRKDGIPIDFEREATVDLDGKPYQTQTRDGARPYNQREIKGLFTKSKVYKGWLTRYYQEKGLFYTLMLWAGFLEA
jgi:hypothetical protein